MQKFCLNRAYKNCTRAHMTLYFDIQNKKYVSTVLLETWDFLGNYENGQTNSGPNLN